MASETCVIGSPIITDYVDQFNKETLSDNDSFLKRFREIQAQNAIDSTIENNTKITAIKNLIDAAGWNNSSAPTISKNLVECSLRRVPLISTTKKICAEADSDLLEPKNSIFYTDETPCITQPMIDYLHWSLNEALRCFQEDLDDIGQKIIFKKINLESSFGFFFQSKNGTGISQVIPKDIQDMLKDGYSGYTFLQNHLRRNPNQCQSFQELFSKDFLVNSQNQIPQCQFIHLGEGIGRSLFAGVGLYIYYRSYHPLSAEKMLSYIGIPKSNSNNYKKMRSTLALGMYNKGPKTVWDSIKLVFQKNELFNKNKKYPKTAFSIFNRRIQTMSFYVYISELESLYERTVDSAGACKLPAATNSIISSDQKSIRPESTKPL